jgi:hypothetical protein
MRGSTAAAAAAAVQSFGMPGMLEYEKKIHEIYRNSWLKAWFLVQNVCYFDYILSVEKL